ncbi:MAG TPA: thioredoxin family protein [Vicinamibacterales bacterium]|nr:thioredoxin family protein [Vicinamibacterales bacterium]
MRRLAAAVALLIVAPCIAFGQFRGVRADLTPVVESDARPGTRVRAALLVRIPERFHVQSNAPRDPSLIATALSFTAPPGVNATEVVYPKATDFEQAGQSQPLAVFEHEFAIGVEFDVEPTTALGPIEIPARLRYQACDDKLCYPPVTADLRWTLTVAAAGATPTKTHSEIFDRIAFGTGAAPALTTGAPVVPAAPIKDGGVAQLDDFSVVATTGGYLGTNDFLTFVRNAENGVKEEGLFEGRGPLAILLIVFLGGLALNLTPCVLPMIPINLAIIGAGAQAGSRGRGFLLGGVYGAAMALVYGVLGVIVITTASTFGTINASPWFNVSIAIIFAVLALAMFDVITIDFSRFAGSAGAGGPGRGTVAVAFGMGAIAALLAGACVAPVVIQVVLFSSDLYAQGSVMALGLPFLLGVGMAVPWPLAGAGLTSLPKPGAWMVRVKQAFGILILATAAYYGYLGYSLFADRWVDASEVRSSVDAQLKAGWHASLADGLTVALREEKPVLIDMWATWCKNCLTMDKTTLADASVKTALAGYVTIKFQAEQPDEEPARGVMERFKAIGLPTYVILRPKTSSPPGGTR